MHSLAGSALSAGRHLGRQRNEFRPLFGKRRQGRIVPLRFGRRHAGDRAASRCREQTDMVWHGYLPDIAARAALRLPRAWPYEPAKGHRFNPNKLLLDPYAKAIARETKWADELWGYKVGDPAGRSFVRRSRQRRLRPAGGRARRGLHLGRRPAAANPLAQDADLRTAREGLHQAASRSARETARHLRRRWAPRRPISYLQSLGITAVELLPVHEHVDDRHLVERGLTNYWGYNTLGFFAPDTRYGSATAPQDVVREFKTMVRNLHSAGIEVILDVVYNHTAEGNQLGPTLSFRGIDNAAYYRLSPEDPRYYMDFTGCGNTLQHAQSPRAAADHGQPALLGRWTCTSMVSASIWPAPWPASCTKSTSWGPSSTSSTRTR